MKKAVGITSRIDDESASDGADVVKICGLARCFETAYIALVAANVRAGLGRPARYRR